MKRHDRQTLASRMNPTSLRPGSRCVVVAICVGTLAGCAGSDPFTQKRMTQGAVRSSLARIEAERDELQKEIAQLRSDQSRLEELLAEERARGDDLATRLDDARNLLEGRGTRLNAGVQSETDRTNSIRAITPSRVTPAGQPRRKVPFAQIPGQITEEPGFSGTRSSLPGRPPESAGNPPDDIFDRMPAEAERP
jgi:hypothetical protein